MASFNENYSYIDAVRFFSEVVTQEFLVTHEAFFVSLLYEGFNVENYYARLRNSAITAKRDGNEFAEDMVKLIALCLTRGNNITKFSKDNMKGYTEVMTLCTRYDIHPNSKGSNMSLSRVCNVFPGTTFDIFSNSIKKDGMSYPVSEIEIGIKNSQLFSCGVVPALLPKENINAGGSAFRFILAVIYSTHQSVKFEVRLPGKSKNTLGYYFGDCLKYALSGNTGSMMPSTISTDMIAKMPLDGIDSKEVVAALQVILSSGFKPAAVEVTQIDRLMAHCHSKGIALSVALKKSDIKNLTVKIVDDLIRHAA